MNNLAFAMQSSFLAQGDNPWLLVWIVGGVLLLIGGLVLVIAFITYGKLWFQAFMSGADISMGSLIGMGFRKVRPQVIVQAKIMAAQAGLDISRKNGISTQRLEAHYLAGGDVMRVINAIIASHRAGSTWILIERQPLIWQDATFWMRLKQVSIRK